MKKLAQLDEKNVMINVQMLRKTNLSKFAFIYIILFGNSVALKYFHKWTY